MFEVLSSGFMRYHLPNLNLSDTVTGAPHPLAGVMSNVYPSYDVCHALRVESEINLARGIVDENHRFTHLGL